MDQNCNLNITLYGHPVISVTDENSEPVKKVAELTMEAFLMDIEKRAYHMAILACGTHADALDLLQDSMIKLVTNYKNRPSNEWKPLFYKILQNRIRDWHRHQKVRNLVFFWKSNSLDDEVEVFSSQVDYASQTTPDKEFEKSAQQTAALKHLKQLSAKQQQCFLLRSWEGLSVAQTADAMGCSQGSVKTHYSRAVTKLKTLMEEDHDITF